MARAILAHDKNTTTIQPEIPKNCLGCTFLVYGMNLIVSALPNFFTV